MKNSTNKKIYLSVTAGIGFFAALPASANITFLNEDGVLPIDGVTWTGETSGNTVTTSGHQGSVTASNGTNSTTVGHSRVTGFHSVGGNNNTWFFDDTGSQETTSNVGGYVDTQQDAAHKQTQAVDVSGKYTSSNQDSTSLYDELIDGANKHTSVRDATGRTDTVTDGASTSTYKQRSTGFEFDGDTTINRSAHVLGNAQIDGLATLNGGLAVGAGTSVNMGGNRVQNVADGIVSSDAVNLRQLSAVEGKLDKRINETGAIAAAFAQLGQAQTPGKSTFGIAAGGQGGKSGLAIGFSHRPVTMKPVVIKASLGASGSTTSGGVGATWEF
jgi:hypothetical protein